LHTRIKYLKYVLFLGDSSLTTEDYMFSLEGDVLSRDNLLFWEDDVLFDKHRPQSFYKNFSAYLRGE
ncbi:hypothetical protein, partial [Coxiella-like endosymbiont]|uniref:hypothetical protein n=1 Tax=Coxiella-like endosymbiont TaxID=1592897 RepID=UPI0019D480C1